MTQDEYEVGSLKNAEKFAIIRMAREAGIAHAAGIYMEHLERFSALVAAHEREKFYGKDKPEECANGCPKNQVCDYCQRAEQAEQEPVAWMQEMPTRGNEIRSVRMTTIEKFAHEEWVNPIPLYAAPVRTKDLTDDEILEITKRFALGIAFPVDGVTTPEMFARAVIAADREKNK